MPILGTSITNIPSDNVTQSDIKKVIKMISTETICAPEQVYMVVFILEVYNSVFSPNSYGVSVKKRLNLLLY